MTKYISIPTEIEAIRLNLDNYNKAAGMAVELWEFMGNDENNFNDIHAFDGADFVNVYDKLHDSWIKVTDGQWIIKGTKGEYYPCDPEVFAAKYREVK